MRKKERFVLGKRTFRSQKSKHFVLRIIYIVTGGLKPGDKIVVEGVQTLKDGQTITPITPEQKEAKYQQHLKDQKEGNIATAFE